MKLKMAENSLFAILLRSPWWYSLLLVAAITLFSAVLIPAPYVPFGVMGGFPFLVTGLMAGWRQRHLPDPARITEIIQQAGAMSWRDFSAAAEQGFTRQGFVVTRLDHTAADFSLLKGERVILVSCKRWKAATLGIEVLRELVAAQGALGAQQGICISLGKVSDSARRFATTQGVHLMPEPELAQLLGTQRPAIR